MRFQFCLKFGGILAVCLLFPGMILGQSQTDSLKQQLRFDEQGQLIADTANVNLLNELGMVYRFINADTTYQYAKLASETAEEIGYTKGKLFAKYLEGASYFYRGQYHNVYNVARQSLKEAGSDSFERERAYLNQLIGLSYASQGSYQPGLQHFLEARDLFEAQGNDHGVFQNVNNIGVSYLKLEDYEKALNIFLELDSLRALEPSTISIPVNLGFIYYELGEYDKAKAQLNRVLSFSADTFDQRALGLANFKLGQVYLAEQEYDTALAHFNRSIDVYEDLNNDTQKIQSFNGIARAYLNMGRTQEALSYANRALRIAEEYDALPERHTTAETLSKIYKATNNYEAALRYHELYKALSDSLHNEDISRRLGRLEAEVEYRERELQLKEAQQQQNLENAEQVATRNFFIVLALALVLLLAVIAYSQYRNSTLRKKANDLLREKNLKIEQQAQRLEEMNEIKTHLFSIIAHDLRGPLSSLYGFITLHEMNELSQKQMQKLIPVLTDKFKYTSTLLNNLLNWAKSQLDGYKVIPETFDLSERVQQTIKILNLQIQEKNIEVHNQLTEPVHVYADPNMVELVLLNLLSNAIKFTPREGEITMSTVHKTNEVVFSIQDNGMGIPEDILEELFDATSFYSTSGTDNEKGTGLGLMLCKDFVYKNNGRIFAESEVGQGSTFYFSLPAGK